MPNPKVFTIGNSTNPMQEKVHVQAIVTLRSGRKVGNHVGEPKEDLAGQEGEESGHKEETDAVPSFVPKAPYPERLQAPKKGGNFEDILEVFK
jgi:hypothetical protein